MSLNKAVNAVIALVENRTDIAKEIFRGPGSDVKNIPAIMTRLDQAVEKAAATAMRNALKRSLAVQLSETRLKHFVKTAGTDTQGAIEAAFYEGVDEIERLFEKIVMEMDPQ